jgi:general secretion pathway protein D
MVRLELNLEVSDLESTTENRPTTLKRTVETTAIVRDRHTVVLGGLIDDNLSTTDYKVPCLGDVPGLGWLFRSMAKSNTKTNLYVFLTPRVIQNSHEAADVYSNKRQDIENIQNEDIKLYPWKSKEAPKSPFPPAIESEHGLPEGGTLTPETPGRDDKIAANDPIGYTIETNSVQSAEAAGLILEELTQKGYPAYMVRMEESGQIWYRLRIGYYKNPEAAEPTIQQLRLNQFQPILIKL